MISRYFGFQSLEKKCYKGIKPPSKGHSDMKNILLML